MVYKEESILEYYYYKHDASEIPLDDVKGDKKLITEKAYHFCPHCNADIVGLWEYYDIKIPRCSFSNIMYPEVSSYVFLPLTRCFRTGECQKTVAECESFYTIKGRKVRKIEDICIKSPLLSKDFSIKKSPCNQAGDFIDAVIFYEKGYSQLCSLMDKYEYILKYREEAIDFLKLDKCPICGSSFSHHYSSFAVKFCFLSKNFRYSDIPFYIRSDETTENFNSTSGIEYDGGRETSDDGESTVPQSWDKLSQQLGFKIKDALTYYEQMKMVFAKANTDRILKETAQKFDVPVNDKTVDVDIAEDTKKLTGYLEQILFAEENIYLLSERLKSLYPIKVEVSSSCKISSLNAQKEKEYNLKQLKAQYKRMLSEQPEKKIKLSDFPIRMPKQPVEPTKPIYPTLEKTGFFNKKRIMAENEIKLNKYNEEIALYEEEISKYQTELSIYNSTVKELKEQQKEKFEAKVANVTQKHKESCEKLEEKINECKNEIKAQKANKNTSKPAKYSYIEEEVSQVEELLQNFYKLRNELYACGVIFEKYRNYVAVAMFCEYLKSGRCEKLEGPTGAYNLYESEIRANIVVNNLNKIVDSLEKIQENQYLIYSGISRMNSELKVLNTTTASMLATLESVDDHMSSVDEHLSSIDSNLEKIEKNTSAIAQNTETTAFYAKKNAELTNAMGYLVALS